MFFAGLCDKAYKIEQILKKFELKKFENFKAKNLSGGYKKLLNIALGLANSPKVLILDEPMANIDAKIKEKIKKLIKELKKEGLSIILVSHFQEEVFDLCDRILLIDKGEQIAFENTENLFSKISEPYRVLIKGSFPKLKTKYIKILHEEENQMELEIKRKHLIEGLIELGELIRAGKVSFIDVKEPSILSLLEKKEYEENN